MRKRTRRCRSAAVVVSACHNWGMSRASDRICSCSAADRVAGWLRQKRCVLFGQPSLLGEGLFPATFQFPGDQAVLRFHGLILPGRTLGLVAGAFELLLPVLVQAPPLLGHIRCRGQVQFQGRRLQDVQDLRADQGIQAPARQALTQRLAVVDAAADATVTEPAPRVGVADQQVTAAAGTDEQAAQAAMGHGARPSGWRHGWPASRCWLAQKRSGVM